MKAYGFPHLFYIITLLISSYDIVKPQNIAALHVKKKTFKKMLRNFRNVGLNSYITNALTMIYLFRDKFYN
jgi:hypothetical protein